jgi:hypothetical protein
MIEITGPAKDTVMAKAGKLDVTFQWNASQSTVVSLTRDEITDLRVAIEVAEASELYDGYEEPDDYCLFTTAGNRAVAEMIDILQAAIKNGLSEDEARSFLDTEMDRIAGQHGEIWDTDVRESIADEITDAWQEAFGEGITL